MRTLTNKHIANINVLMLTLIAEYTEDSLRNNSAEASMIKMYATDIAYNTRILAEFNAEPDTHKLHKDIIYQDTIVREHFVEVLQYIEEHNLISSDYFACK